MALQTSVTRVCVCGRGKQTEEELNASKDEETEKKRNPTGEQNRLPTKWYFQPLFKSRVITALGSGLW